MKKLSFVQLYRPELARLVRNLDEREIVMFLVLIVNAGWDPRHKNHYGKVNKTFREIKDEFLPMWSVGKIFNAITKLKEHGFVEVYSKRCFLINYIWIYTAPKTLVSNVLSNPEHSDQLPKQIFHDTEHNISAGERLNLQKKLNGIAESMRMPRAP